MELDPQVSPAEEIMSRGGGAGLRKLDFFRFGLFLNSSATDIVLVILPGTAVETAIAQCTSRCAMTRGHRLNTSIVLAAVHGLSGLFRAVSAVEPSLSRPPPPPSPRPSRFCGRKAKRSWTETGRQDGLNKLTNTYRRERERERERGGGGVEHTDSTCTCQHVDCHQVTLT